MIVLGGNQLQRETIALNDEADDIQHLIKNINQKAKRKVEAHKTNDRKAYEESPGKFMGIEHYIDTEM